MQMINEPIFLDKPSLYDFYYDGGFDEKYAIEKYYNKDIDFARKQYNQFTPLSVLQDLNFIGIKAFRYYIFGAFRYLQDVDNIDFDEAIEVYCALVEMLRKRFIENFHDMLFIATYIIDFSNWAIEHYALFNVNETVYGNIKERYEQLILNAKETLEVLS